MISKPKEKLRLYTGASVIFQLFFDIELIDKVPNSAFEPKPLRKCLSKKEIYSVGFFNINFTSSIVTVLLLDFSYLRGRWKGLTQSNLTNVSLYEGYEDNYLTS